MNTVDKVLSIAMAEVGYMEKSHKAYMDDPDILYEKTKGAGSNNYTKYGKEMHKLYPQVMDFPAPWCDAFVDWCFYKAYGVTTAKSLLGGNFNDYTVASCRMYQQKNALFDMPKIGDQVFFTKTNMTAGCYHTGLVYDVDSQYFYTIEGNTSSSKDVVANGGCVAKKKYKLSTYRGKCLFGRPKYDGIPTKSYEQICDEVIAGRWGTGARRRINLEKAGYSYEIIQRMVNDKLGN